MKILHVVPTYLPARRYGGPIFAVHGLASALAARGHDVDIFTTDVDGPNESDVPLGTLVELDGAGVFYFPSSFRRLYWSPRMREALKESISSYDIAHLHSVFLYPTAAAARAARRASVPYVISPRGMLVSSLIDAKSRWVKTAWLRLVERRNFEGASAIHFTSQRELDDARQTRVPIPRHFIVPNGIALHSPAPAERDAHTLLFLGRINWKKGIDRLIAAMPFIERARLVVAGNDEENLTPRLRELAERLHVASRIDFAGPVNGAAKDAMLSKATIFVLTSISENFGNAVLEAMAAGTPVVVTPEVGLSDEVRRARAGIVAPYQPRELADAVNTLLRDRTELSAMGERGRRAAERFAWPRVAEEMENEYAKLVRDHPGHPDAR